MKMRTKIILIIAVLAAFYVGLVLRTGDLGVKKVSKDEITEFISDVPGTAEVTIPIVLREGNPEHESDHFIGPYRGLKGIRKVTLLPVQSSLTVVFDPSQITEEQVKQRLH